MGSLFLVGYTCPLKRYIVWELQVKFYLGQNEGRSPEDSTSDNSEKLLQRGSGGKVNTEDFGDGGVQHNHGLTLQEAFH